MKISFEGSQADLAKLIELLSTRKASTLLDEVDLNFSPSGLSIEPLPQPKEGGVETKQELPHIEPEKRHATLVAWKNLCREWVEGFGVENAAQPDRLKLLREFGSSPYFVPLLIMAYEKGSLQQLISDALSEDGDVVPSDGTTSSWLDFVQNVAGNMVQLSHMACPDLEGTYDYSSKWRKGQ